LNNECIIFYDVMYRKKKNIDEPFDLSMSRGANTSKTFTLLFLIQGLLFFITFTLVQMFKKEPLLVTYIKKPTFNIDRATIHSSPSIVFNCKDLPSLSS